MRGAEDQVYKLANEMGQRYIEDPPLVQAANARIKIARVAIAIAARTFSTDDSCEKIVVTKEHVQDAVKFMDVLYDMPTLGYGDRSRERILDVQEATAPDRPLPETGHRGGDEYGSRERECRDQQALRFTHDPQERTGQHRGAYAS
jgi:hypothetical protein